MSLPQFWHLPSPQPRPYYFLLQILISRFSVENGRLLNILHVLTGTHHRVLLRHGHPCSQALAWWHWRWQEKSGTRWHLCESATAEPSKFWSLDLEVSWGMSTMDALHTSKKILYFATNVTNKISLEGNWLVISSTIYWKAWEQGHLLSSAFETGKVFWKPYCEN